MHTFYLLLYLLALVCFVVAFSDPTDRVATKFNVEALGFAFFVLVPFLQTLMSSI